MSDFSFCEKRRNYNIQYEKKGGSISFNRMHKEESINNETNAKSMYSSLHFLTYPVLYFKTVI